MIVRMLNWWRRYGGRDLSADCYGSIEGQPREPARDLPYPPEDLMRSVGPTNRRLYDNPTGGLIFGDEVPERCYESVFDFGCGCGRLARQLMQQNSRPRRYLGVDLFARSIRWCRANLTARDPGFVFLHHDVYNATFNPSGRRSPEPLPGEDGVFSLIIAHSVFTHITQSSIGHYLSEIARLLQTRVGVFKSTWFLFDRRSFPFMHEDQAALYINLTDPSQAVIFDSTYVRQQFERAGLSIYKVTPPEIRGFHWELFARRDLGGCHTAQFPEDNAPFGIARPPRSVSESCSSVSCR
jgi:SAM-dependent methyltransferase